MLSAFQCEAPCALNTSNATVTATVMVRFASARQTAVDSAAAANNHHTALARTTTSGERDDNSMPSRADTMQPNAMSAKHVL